MIDADVLRLRNLRNVALRARALAKALASGSDDPDAFAESAVICWTIGRIASGTLRAHPYLKYQRGPSPLRAAVDLSICLLIAWVARRRGRSCSVLAAQLHHVAREVTDLRALTWLPDLSDALGRAQLRVRRLIATFDASARSESGAATQPIPAGARADISGAPLDGPVASDWPYLAI
jgi:hypothetical protein